MVRGAWWAAIHGVAKSRTRPSDFTFAFHFPMHWRRKWQPTPVLLPGESQGQGSLVGCRLWGHAELDMTEVTWQQQQLHEMGHLSSLSPALGVKFIPSALRSSDPNCIIPLIFLGLHFTDGRLWDLASITA